MQVQDANVILNNIFDVLILHHIILQRFNPSLSRETVLLGMMAFYGFYRYSFVLTPKYAILSTISSLLI
jgi:hypothetical protein